MKALFAFLCALAMTDAAAQTYTCNSRTTPGQTYLSYGTPCPPGTEVKKARPQTALRADARGQYLVTAMINGVPTNAVIDTGATNVSMNMEEARRLGVDFAGARKGISHTANGSMTSWQVTLARVQVGDAVLLNVPGSVSEGGNDQMRIVLIGMSFLRHFEIKHVGDTLTLQRP